MNGKRTPSTTGNTPTRTAKGKAGAEDSRSFARASLAPTFQAAITLQQYGKPFGELNINGLADALLDQVKATNTGASTRAEAMLTAQAHTLDAIFHNLARRAINAHDIGALERYLKLALRAQSQSRATWETLSTVQNPPVASYVRQANIAHGPQQVNNMSPAPDGAPPARAREKKT